jgi:hypothetical protein
MKEAKSFQGRSEREVFFEALDENTPRERAAFLDGACGEKPAPRARRSNVVSRVAQIQIECGRMVSRAQGKIEFIQH